MGSFSGIRVSMAGRLGLSVQRPAWPLWGRRGGQGGEVATGAGSDGGPAQPPHLSTSCGTTAGWPCSRLPCCFKAICHKATHPPLGPCCLLWVHHTSACPIPGCLCPCGCHRATHLKVHEHQITPQTPHMGLLAGLSWSPLPGLTSSRQSAHSPGHCSTSGSPATSPEPQCGPALGLWSPVVAFQAEERPVL